MVREINSKLDLTLYDQGDYLKASVGEICNFSRS